MWYDEDFMDLMIMDTEGCFNCISPGPPPNTILHIPPPPMPSALLTAFNEALGNDSNGPCPLLCDWTTGQGVEMNELPHIGSTRSDSWILFIVLAFIFVGSFLAVALLKYRRSKNMESAIRKKVFNHRTYESILYPPLEENRDLWATISPKGKQQHIALPPPLPPRINHKSFENSAYADMEEYAQNYSRRPRVSFPMKIDNPNIPPLNYYPSLKKNYPSLI